MFIGASFLERLKDANFTASLVFVSGGRRRRNALDLPPAIARATRMPSATLAHSPTRRSDRARACRNRPADTPTVSSETAPFHTTSARRAVAPGLDRASRAGAQPSAALLLPKIAVFTRPRNRIRAVHWVPRLTSRFVNDAVAVPPVRSGVVRLGTKSRPSCVRSDGGLYEFRTTPNGKQWSSFVQLWGIFRWKTGGEAT